MVERAEPLPLPLAEELPGDTLLQYADTFGQLNNPNKLNNVYAEAHYRMEAGLASGDQESFDRGFASIRTLRAHPDFAFETRPFFAVALTLAYRRLWQARLTTQRRMGKAIEHTYTHVTDLLQEVIASDQPEETRNNQVALLIAHGGLLRARNSVFVPSPPSPRENMNQTNSLGNHNFYVIIRQGQKKIKTAAHIMMHPLGSPSTHAEVNNIAMLPIIRGALQTQPNVPQITNNPRRRKLVYEYIAGRMSQEVTQEPVDEEGLAVLNEITTILHAVSRHWQLLDKQKPPPIPRGR